MSIIEVDDKNFHSLIERLNNGDETAFDEIYKKCCAPISFLCQKFCDNKEDAEEVVQDTFIIAHKKASDLRADTLMAYLRKIAIHECFRKRNKNRLSYEYLIHTDSLAETLPELSESFLPEAALQNKELQTELLRIINQLPKNRREMVYLYYYAGLNTEEIARLYDCSATTVRTTLFAAKKTIKTKLEGTDSKYGVKGLALIPLVAIFVVEEQVYAASYVPMAAPSIVAAEVVSTVATVAAKSTTGYIIAVCALAVCGISLAVYLTTLPNAEQYEPTYDSYAELPIYEEEPPTYEIEESTEYEPEEEPHYEPYTPYEPLEYEAETYQPQAEEPYDPPTQYEPYVPQAVEEPTPPIEEPQAAQEPTEVYEEPTVYEPQEEPYEPQDEEPEDEPYEPAPELVEEELEPIDRTPQILAALAQANNAVEVNRIISYYGFEFDTQIHLDMWYRFYVLDDGSGDILIGIAAHTDGIGWRMRFTHFENGTMPLDILQLLQFMEQ